MTDEHYMLEYTPLNEYEPTSSSLTTSENCSLKCSDDGMVGLKAGGYQKSEACGDCDWSDPEAQRSAICATTYSFQIQRIMNSALVLLVFSFISLPISQAVLSYIGRCCCQNEG